MQSRDRYAQTFLEKNENYTIEEAYKSATSAQLLEAGMKVAIVGGALALTGVVHAFAHGLKHAARIEKEKE